MSIYIVQKVCENVCKGNSDGKDCLFKNISLLFASFRALNFEFFQLLNTFCICTLQTVRIPTVFEKKKNCQLFTITDTVVTGQFCLTVERAIKSLLLVFKPTETNYKRTQFYTVKHISSHTKLCQCYLPYF
jgi:hypothetical protein